MFYDTMDEYFYDLERRFGNPKYILFITFDNGEHSLAEVEDESVTLVGLDHNKIPELSKDELDRALKHLRTMFDEDEYKYSILNAVDYAMIAN